MLVNRNDEAICSETVILSMRLDDFVNLAVFLQPPGLDSIVSWHRLAELAGSCCWRGIRAALRGTEVKLTSCAIFPWILKKMAAQRPSPSICNKHWVLKMKFISYSVRLPARDTAVHSAEREQKYSTCFCKWL